ncbi:MAG: malate synthase A [Ignavibacteriales bacterium]|nr:malate synthase A [Ignavibacteriales bacterium]
MMSQIQYHLQEGVSISDAVKKHPDLLTPAALRFIVTLEREFGERRRALLRRRQERQNELIIGKMPSFPKETEHIRTSYWKVAPIPYPLLDRRIELVGPPDTKTIVDALNSSANVFVADFEDTFSPTWENVVQGHSNIHDGIHGSLMYADNEGRQHAIVQNSVTLIVRPRGLQALEKHILVEGRPISASIFDFGLFVFHNTEELRAQGKGPYIYVAKIENQQEAKLWNDIFLMTQDELQVPHGTIKATVSIETLTAAFETQEIMYELRDHCVGLQCNWWNYVFSFMKKVRHLSEYVVPDVVRLSTMTNFLHSLSLLTIQTSHKRGVHALAGPTTLHPATVDGTHNEALMIKIHVDKSREAEEGFDGTWIMHPAILPISKMAFDEAMKGPNQLHRKRDDVIVTESDLLTVHRGEMNIQDFQSTIRSLLEYISSWISGKGMLIKNDTILTATEAEIARTQLWQWKHIVRPSRTEGTMLTDEMYKKSSGEELKRILSIEKRKEMIQQYTVSKSILDRLILDKSFSDFFSTLAYNHIE